MLLIYLHYWIVPWIRGICPPFVWIGSNGTIIMHDRVVVVRCLEILSLWDHGICEAYLVVPPPDFFQVDKLPDSDAIGCSPAHSIFVPYDVLRVVPDIVVSVEPLMLVVKTKHMAELMCLDPIIVDARWSVAPLQDVSPRGIVISYVARPSLSTLHQRSPLHNHSFRRYCGIPIVTSIVAVRIEVCVWCNPSFHLQGMTVCLRSQSEFACPSLPCSIHGNADVLLSVGVSEAPVNSNHVCGVSGPPARDRHWISIRVNKCRVSSELE
jgi:hypothetical protein